MLTVAAVAVAALPSPPQDGLVAWWPMQEPTGQPRVSRGPNGYAIRDHNTSFPVLQVQGGVWGAYSADFVRGMRLEAPRSAVPALANISGPDAHVSIVAWLRRNASSGWNGGAYVAGMWDEHLAARSWAMFLNVGACGKKGYPQGVNAHISAVGGPTPGSRFCTTAACGSTRLEKVQPDWHCAAATYDGTAMRAFLDGRLDAPAGGDPVNPFEYAKGIFGGPGAVADFAMGANYVNETAGSPAILHNFFEGRVGGLAVYRAALSQAEVQAVCDSAPGYTRPMASHV